MEAPKLDPEPARVSQQRRTTVRRLASLRSPPGSANRGRRQDAGAGGENAAMRAGCWRASVEKALTSSGACGPWKVASPGSSISTQSSQGSPAEPAVREKTAADRASAGLEARAGWQQEAAPSSKARRPSASMQRNTGMADRREDDLRQHGCAGKNEPDTFHALYTRMNGFDGVCNFQRDAPRVRPPGAACPSGLAGARGAERCIPLP